MTTQVLDRIMDGVKTPEGKVIAVLLALCLSLMSWNIAALSYAVSSDANAAGEQEAAEQQAALTGEAANTSEDAQSQESASEASETQQDAEQAPEEATAGGQQAQSEAANGAEAPSATVAGAATQAEDVKHPAVSFSGSANGVDVSVEAPEGAFPEGTTMHVSSVAASAVMDVVENAVDGSVASVKAVDIVFIDKDGKEIEPKVAIKVSLSSSVIERAESDESKTIEVVHIDDNANATVVDQENAGTAADEVAFTSDEFSIYVLAELQDTILLTYKFQNDTTTVATEYVKVAGGTVEKLYDPGVVASEGQTFAGWAFSEDETDNAKVFTVDQLNQRLAEEVASGAAYEDGQEFTVYAIFRDSYHLRLLTEDENGRLSVLRTYSVLRGDTDRYVTIDYSYNPSEEEVFQGWLDPKTGNVYQQNQRVQLDGNLDLYLKAEGRYWLIFDDNDGGVTGGGASYTPPQLVIGNEAPSAPDADPVWTGYNFAGWNTKPDGSGDTWTADSFASTSLKADTILYAQWEAAEAEYYVIFWKQKATDEADAPDADKTYEYVSSERRTAHTGESVAITNYDKTKAANANSEYSSYYFKFNESKSDANPVTISADGTTVLNVYYDRQVYTLTFQAAGYKETTSNSGTQYGYYNGQYVPIYKSGNTWYRTRTQKGYSYSYSDPYNGKRYTSESAQTIKEIKALYGHSIKDEFPIVGSNGVTYQTGTRWMPQSNLNVDGVSYFKTNTVVAYIDIMTPGNMTLQWNDPESRTEKTMVYWVEALDGVAPDGVATTTFEGKLYQEYKTVKAFYNGVTVEDYIDIPGFTKYKADKSIGSNDYYVEGSGNKNQSTTATEVNFYYSRNMPSVHFVSQGQYVKQRTEEARPIYFEAPLADYAQDGPSYYEPDNGIEGYYFDGWYVDESCTTEFDFAGTAEPPVIMPENDITLYAKWTTNRVRTVFVPTPNNAHNDQVQFANNQELTFRLDYNEKVSDANINSNTALRTGYELDGWYTSPTFEANTKWNFSTQVNKSVPGVNMDYQNSDDWARYGDNDGKHNNVRGILKLYAKWNLSLVEDSVYIVYDVPEDYRLYDSLGDLQTTMPIDRAAYVIKGDEGAQDVNVLEAPTGLNDAFYFTNWVLLDSEGNETDTVVAAGSTWQIDPDEKSDNYYGKYIKETTVGEGDESGTMRTITFRAQAAPVTGKATSVTYKGNGGVRASNGATEMVQGVALNAKFNLASADIFEREGYTFAGWSTTAVPTGDDDSRLFAAGTEVAADNDEGAAWEEDDSTNTLYAQWNPIIYNITYDLDGGALPEGVVNPGTYTADDEIALTAPQRAHYVFSGWVEVADDETETAVSGVAIPKGSTGDKHFKATWELQKHTVAFVNDDDAEISKAQYEYGTPAADIAIPDNPAKAQDAQYIYTFAGWDKAIVDVTGDITYKATYTAALRQYTITYVDGVEDEVVFDDQAFVGNYGEGTPAYTAPERAGYAFAAWSPEVAATVAGDATYTATWTERNDVQYKIQYWQQNIADDGYAIAANETVTRANGTTNSTVSVMGNDIKSFAGFTYNAGKSTTSAVVAADGSTTLNLYYDRNSYEVSYAYDATYPGASTPPNAVSYKYGATVGVAGDATAPGYTFKGWMKGNEAAGASFEMPAEPVRIVGSFAADRDVVYKTEYYQQNVSDNGYELAETVTAADGTTGETVNADTAKAYAGFHFSEDNGQNVLSGEVLGDGSLVLKVYYDRDTFTVTYTDGFEGEPAFADQVTEGLRYGSQTPEFVGVAARAGYEFASWSPAVAPTVTADATYAAQWAAKDNAYKVEHYLQNVDGVGYSIDAAATENNTAKTDAGVSAAARAFTGFTFDEANEGNVTEGTVAADGSTTLKLYYARDQHTVTYSYEGAVPVGAGAAPASATYYYGADVAVEANPATPAGYTFGGWKIGAADAADFTMGTADVAIAGSFAANADTPYTVEYYLQGAEGDEYTLQPEATEHLTGTTDATATVEGALLKSFDNFTYNADARDGQGNGLNVLSGTIAGDGSLVLKVYYDRDVFTVAYSIAENASGAQVAVPAQASYRFGATVDVADTPAAPIGYTFNGWFRDGGTAATAGSFTMPAANVAMTGTITANADTAYTVEHYLQNIDGTYPANPADVDNLTGSTGEQTAAAAKSYEGFTAPQEVAQAEIAADGSTVIRIEYTRNAHTVTYDYGTAPAGASALPQGSERVMYGDTYTVEPAATAPGYEFAGWSKDGEQASSFSMPDADVVLTGSFVASTTTPYRVEYHLQNIDDDGYSVDADRTEFLTGTTDTAVSADPVAINGFTYHSAVIADENGEQLNVSSGNVAGDGSLVLRLYYDRNSYTVAYSYTNGTVPAGATSLDGEAYNGENGSREYRFGERVSIAAAATAPGYAFSGWKNGENPAADFGMPANNVNLRGMFSANANTPYKVEYYYQSGGAYADTADAADATRFGTTDTAVAATNADRISKREGYVLDEAADNVFEANLDGTGGTVLKVHFKQQFAITYQPGDHGTFQPQSTGSLDYGAATPNAPDAARQGQAGYTFVGWSPELNPTVTCNVDYVAQWAANEDTPYSVEYYYQENGTYNGVEPVVGQPRLGVTDQPVSIVASDKVPTNGGYVLDEAADNVFGVDALDGAGSTVLKVYFKQQFSVTYQPGDHAAATAAPAVSQNLDYGTSTPAAPAFEAAIGYAFANWDKQLAANVTENATYTAQWTAIEYAITYDLADDAANPAANDPANPTSYTVEDSVVLVDPTRPGYTFAGWAEDGETTADIAKGTTGEKTFTATWVADFDDVVVVADGIATNGFDVTYDGQQHTIALRGTRSGDVVAFDGATVENDTYSLIDATAENNAVSIVVTRGSESKTFEGVSANIKPVELTIRSADATKTYDGTPLKAESASITSGAFVSGEGAQYAYSGEQTLVGSAENAFDITLNPGTKPGNYAINKVAGTLTVVDAGTPSDPNDPGSPTNPFDPKRVIVKLHDPKASASDAASDAGEATWSLGDEVTFSIDVTNIYDEEKTVTASELLNGATFAAQDGVTLSEGAAAATFTLAAGDSITLTATYTVTEADIAAGSVTNSARVAFAGGTIPTNGPFSAEDTVNTDEPESKLAVEKVLLTEADENGTYKVGQTIEYAITVTNAGNQTVNDVVVSDELRNATGSAAFDEASLPEGAVISGNTVAIGAVAPGEDNAVTIGATYTIALGDSGQTIGNTAVAEGDQPEGTPTQSGASETATVEDAYELTVHYEYATGGTVAPDFSDRFTEGATYDVTFPTMEGFTTSVDGTAVSALSGSMPAQDVEVTVVYTAPVTPAAAAGGAGGTGGVTSGTIAAAASPIGTIAIDDNGNPLIEAIADSANALAGGAGAWSLFDLICTIVAVVLGLVMLIGMVGRKREDGDDDGDPDNSPDNVYDATDEEEQEPDEVAKRHRIMRGAGVVLAVLSIIVLLVTQDFTQQMGIFDMWSILFAIIAIASIVLTVMSRKKTEDDDDGEEDEEQQAGFTPATA